MIYVSSRDYKCLLDPWFCDYSFFRGKVVVFYIYVCTWDEWSESLGTCFLWRTV